LLAKSNYLTLIEVGHTSLEVVRHCGRGERCLKNVVWWRATRRSAYEYGNFWPSILGTRLVLPDVIQRDDVVAVAIRLAIEV